VSSAPEFRYTLDAPYLEAAHAHLLALLPAWRRALLRALWPGLPLGVCALIAWRYHAQPLELWISLAVVAGVFAYHWRKERRQRLEPFRGTALENAPVRVVLGEQGVEIEVADSTFRVAWATHVRARAFEDGWVLAEATGESRWLPKSGLRGATPEQVDECLRARVIDFARVP
jgi:hypothetical protein